MATVKNEDLELAFTLMMNKLIFASEDMDLSWNSDERSKFLELMESADDDTDGTERN